MAGTEDDESEASAPAQGGDGGDWTTWLRSRLERVAAPERRQEASKDDEERTDPHGVADAGPPPPVAPPLPPSERESGPDLGLRLQWPSHPLEPQQPGATRDAAQQRSTQSAAAQASAATSAPPASPAPAARPVPPASSDAPARPQATRPDQPAPAGSESSPGGHPAPAPPGARALSGLTQPLPSVPAHELVAGLDRLRSAVSSLSARVDGFADATVNFRSVMNERLDEYTETVLRAAKASASDLQEYRRMHAVSLGELRRNANDTADTLRRLTGWMEELARVQGDDERWATALGQAFDEAAAERREGDERALAVVSELPERLQRIEEVLDELATQPPERDRGPLALAGSDLGERLEAIERTMARVDEELRAEPADPLLPVVGSLGERLDRIEQALEDLAAEAAQGDQSPTAPVVSTLVERLEAIERTMTDLGEELVERPPAAPVLDDGQLDAIAAAVAERVRARASGDASEPAPARTSSVRAAEGAPTPPRSRRTAPIRAPSRPRSRPDR